MFTFMLCSFSQPQYQVFVDFTQDIWIANIFLLIPDFSNTPDKCKIIGRESKS